jgi:hypothetical protein
MKKNIIFTSTDSKFGDFTINHWFKSLRENVNLKNIDVVVLDYGMTNEQVEELKKEGAIVLKCVRDGHVCTIRFRDMRDYLIKNKEKYDQVIMTDGGDVIFQEDLSKILNEDKDKFRVVAETNYILDLTELFSKGSFIDEDLAKIKVTLKDKRMINAGVVFGPTDKFVKMSDEIFNLITDKSRFGPDQIALDYILYRDGTFKLIDEKYNFIPATCDRTFAIKDGVFYFSDGEKISIIHNAGRIKSMRIMKNFGHGKERNKIKRIRFFMLRQVGKLRKKTQRN